MTGYEETMRGLGAGTVKVLLQVWDAVERGDIARGDFAEVAAQIVAVANEQGRAVAELALNGYLTAALGEVTVTAPLPAVNDTYRLKHAMATILANEGLDTRMQLARIGQAEPLEAAARRFSEGIAARAETTGWVRQLEPGACQLCQWWARGGRVWPKDHPMPTHKGCTCNPLPTVGRVASTGYTRKLARAREAEENAARQAVEPAPARGGASFF